MREKEKFEGDKISSLVKAFKFIMIKLLGLDLMNDRPNIEDKQQTDMDGISFIPLSLIAGRREVAQIILDKLDKDEAATKAIDDAEFEKMSAAIAEGDMSPIFDGESPKDIINEIQNRAEELQKIGVSLTNTTPNVPHIDVGKPKSVKIEFDDAS